MNNSSIKQSIKVAVCKMAAVKTAISFQDITDRVGTAADSAADFISEKGGAASDYAKGLVSDLAAATSDPEISRDQAYTRAISEDTVNSGLGMAATARHLAPVMASMADDKPVRLADSIRLLKSMYDATEYPAKAMMHTYDPHPITGIKPPTASRYIQGGRYDRHPIDKLLAGKYYDSADDAVYNAKDYLKGYAGRNLMGLGLIDAGFNKSNNENGLLAGLAGGGGLIAANNLMPLLAAGLGIKGIGAIKRLLGK